MLVKAGRIAEDIFANVPDGEAVPEGAAIVSLKRFLAEGEALLGRGAPLGVRLESEENPEVLGARVHGLAVVVLAVPKFRDGRAFSWARLLRTRMGYKGEVRVTGHVLRDQYAFYARVGVDAFEITQNLSMEEFQAAMTEISEVYQPAPDGKTTIWEKRRGR